MDSITIEKLDPTRKQDELLVRGDLLDFMLETFEENYPAFARWYKTKVVIGFNAGERAIYVVRCGGTLRGVSLLRLPTAPYFAGKLCSYYISPEIRGCGVGSELMNLSLNELLAASSNIALWQVPVVATIAEERLLERVGRKTLLDFFGEYGFRVTDKVPGMYRRGKDEYIVHQTLPVLLPDVITDASAQLLLVR